MNSHNKAPKENLSQKSMPDVELVEKLWNLLQDEEELTASNLKKILEKYGFTQQPGSGSSHYVMQAPENLKGFGSITLTSKLGTHIIDKMLAKNFTKFLSKYAPDKIDILCAPSSPSNKVEDNAQHTGDVLSSVTDEPVITAITLPAYAHHIRNEQLKSEVNKQELKQKLLARAKSIFETVEEKKLLKNAINDIAAELDDFKDVLTLCYLKWLTKLDTFEESIPVIQKIAELSTSAVVKNSSFLTDTIPTLIYNCYAEHLSKLMLQLKSESLEKNQRFLIIEECINLNAHIISMARPPIELLKHQYPIVLFKKTTSDEWMDALKRISYSCVLFYIDKMVQLDNNLGTLGIGQQIVSVAINESSHSSSAVQKKTEALLAFAQKYKEVVQEDALPSSQDAEQIKFDWYDFAYKLANAFIGKYHYRLLHMQSELSTQSAIELMKTVIALLKYSMGGKLTCEETADLNMLIFSCEVELLVYLCRNNQVDQAMTGLKTIIQKFDMEKDVDPGSLNDRILHAIMNCIEYLINHIQTKNNFIYYLEICELAEKFSNLNPRDLHPPEQIGLIQGALNTAAQCMRTLNILENPEDKKVLEVFLAQKNPSISNVETGAFQNLLLKGKQKYELSQLVKNADKISKKIQAELNAPAKGANAKKSSMKM